ncbi:hypothetical protein Dsin_020142 [Dipteronia sinensis]|uniref:DUF8039 domain-containing protein n=1 Tax=Dipteronia sinensis TaxID=43782 RepID=A0AAE0E3Q4_9ROSI|nr:hypothetical protein Dsin_020142 [Dipteronia sinensis]
MILPFKLEEERWLRRRLNERRLLTIDTARPIHLRVYRKFRYDSFGPERRGQVRALGFGVTPSRVHVHIQSSGRVKELESLVRTQGQQIVEPVEKIQEMSALLLKQSELVNDKHEHSKCQLLHWYGDNVEEVVAEGNVASTDPNTKVHHVPLGRDFWRVWEDLVFNSKVILVRPTDEARTLGGVVESTIA